ncbi:MAG: two pore domain potassium channel family protein, partial [Duncaniella sp.]|nr:two pore domain potassium channel family protein [Duncaniella sp.]
FCSLSFFVSENPVNPQVPDYWSSLLWSIMSLTTAGSSIHAVTMTGRVLGVLLSAMGLIFFPIFTVFLTDSYSNQMPSQSDTDDATSQTSPQSSASAPVSGNQSDNQAN